MNNVKDCRCLTGKIRFINFFLSWNRTALCQYLHLGGILVSWKSSSKKQNKLLCKVVQLSAIHWAEFLGRAHHVKYGFALLCFNACRVKSWRTLSLYFELQLFGSWELHNLLRCTCCMTFHATKLAFFCHHCLMCIINVVERSPCLECFSWQVLRKCAVWQINACTCTYTH